MRVILEKFITLQSVRKYPDKNLGTFYKSYPLPLNSLSMLKVDEGWC